MNRWTRILSVIFFGAALAWGWRALPAGLSRGPYLQDLTETEITVVFESGTTLTPVLRFGRRPGAWDFEETGTSGTRHVFRLENLVPETTYYYEIASGSSVLAGGENLRFRTAPAEKSRAPFRFLAWGDSGVGTTAQIDLAKKMEQVVPAPELALGLGDLVYESGQADGYDPRLFGPYSGIFPRMTFWPTIGNHDAKTSNGAPYIDNFYLPTDTGAPGQPSNTERYYSFDYGMAHFVCLDSETSSTSPGSPMYDWCEADLDDARARGKRWIFAFFHHPPYSRGTHGDDSNTKGDLVPLLESKGVDMVLAGHSHVYERSFLIKGNAVAQNDASTYAKIGSPDGTLYLVSGCGGKSGSGSLDHPLMSVSKGDVIGFNTIDVGYEEVRGYFMEKSGTTTDLFTLRKETDVKAPRIAHVDPVSSNEVALSYDEPVKSGTGTTGAENVGNYLLTGGSVLGAALDSDQKTVKLTTSALTANTGYELSVLRVQDTAGNDIDQTVWFALQSGSTTPPGTVIPEGADWRYFKGSSAPPSNWNATAFGDSTWSQGPAGFGFEDADDETELLDMRDSYLSVYVRKAFTVADPSKVTALALRVNFDDGFVAYLNGTEVARVNVPSGATNTTAASAGHEAAGFESFNLDGQRGLLVAGDNVLALQGHNSSISSNDFSLHPALAMTVQGSGGGGGSGPPVAVLDCDVQTANVSTRIAFDSSRSDDNGTIVRTTWDFGDGSLPVTAASVDHTFDHAGIFTVTLVVEDDSGLEGIDQRVIRIHSVGSTPTARLVASATQIDAGDTVTFNSAGSTDPDGGSILTLWEFGDPASGTDNRAASGAPAHTFDAEGTYTVTLNVVDEEGSGDSQTTVVQVGAASGTAPVAGFALSSSSGRPGQQIAFTDQSTGTVTGWAWDFGDGSSSTLQSPTHAYGQVGTYDVTLEVTNPDGSDTSTQQIEIGQVVADFRSTSDELEVRFTDLSTGDITSRTWDFGDGETSSERHPVHVYAAEGEYTVTLTVSGPNGTDTSAGIVQVEETPTGGGGGGTSGGGCMGSIDEGHGSSGDPSLLLMLSLVFAALAAQRRAQRAGRTRVA